LPWYGNDSDDLEFIEINATLDRFKCHNNYVFNLGTASPLILVATGKLLTQADIGWNRLFNQMTANELFISNDGTTNTGILHNNYVGHKDVTGAHDPGWDGGGFRLFNNLCRPRLTTCRACDPDHGRQPVMLRPEQCFRLVKPVDIEAAVAVLPRLQFVGVNQGGTDTSRYPCFVVLHDKFPPELTALVEGLGLGGTCARAILRKLMPRQCIPPHVDAWMPSELNWSRYQLPHRHRPRHSHVVAGRWSGRAPESRDALRGPLRPDA
jgi:hypothetical protein